MKGLRNTAFLQTAGPRVSVDETFKESEIWLCVFVEWQTGFVSAFKTKPCHSGPLCIPGY